jgi:hypothetical protein
MNDAELAERRFEFESQMARQEFDLKQKELDLRIEEQKSRKVFTPLVLSIAAGFISLMTSIISNWLEHTEALELEKHKLQSTLLVKVSEERDYTKFATMLSNFQQLGLLELTPQQLLRLKTDRLRQDPQAQQASQGAGDAMGDTILSKISFTLPTKSGTVAPPIPANPVWAIVSGADVNLRGALTELQKAKQWQLPMPALYFRSGTYRLCIGRYNSSEEAVADLVTAKDRINPGAYIVQLQEWCPTPKITKQDGYDLHSCQ